MPSRPDTEPNILVNGRRLSVVDKFTFFGSTVSKSVLKKPEGKK